MNTPTPLPMTEAEKQLTHELRCSECYADSVAHLRAHVAAEVAVFKREGLRQMAGWIESKKECEALRAQTALLRENLEIMLNVAENADETGYVADAGFIDLDKLHEKVRSVLAATSESASAELADLRKESDRIEQLHRIVLSEDPARQFHKLERGPVPNTVTLTIYNGREMVEYTADHLRDAIDAAMKAAR